ncbi:MAG: hydroxymethylglutaryl-CoA reductase, degradative [Saprospiraceae bacterium]|nr:hydroxymethylglutaryl-CoA reductase, degradative [Saprospiraceae bacterium]
MSTAPKQPIAGFSKLSKVGKIKWIVENFFREPDTVMRELTSYWHHNEDQQKVLDGFSENTISNFLLPYGVAPNVMINGQYYCVPMVIEESSVVAAASSAAKFWMDRGGFKARVISMIKKGQVHFLWKGPREKIREIFPELKDAFCRDVQPHIANMEKRGGGIRNIQLRELPEVEAGYYQIDVDLETCDSMGANFTNTVLESFAQTLIAFFEAHPGFSTEEREVRVIMSILSNYTPDCVVRAEVWCAIQDLGTFPNQIQAEEFAEKFALAVQIAKHDPYRATTHNKGIFNGVDAVVIATGNDFRAVEACGHAYAARDGQYRSLSDCKVKDGIFRFWLEIPLALGTVGGLTNLHPMAKRSLELLGDPTASELMQIVASVGLAQNFAALRSLVTTGIQQGHMKMHLQNILNTLGASDPEKNLIQGHFSDKVITYQGVREYLERIRDQPATFAVKP